MGVGIAGFSGVAVGFGGNGVIIGAIGSGTLSGSGGWISGLKLSGAAMIIDGVGYCHVVLLSGQSRGC